MLHIEIFTMNNEFKDSSNNIYRITNNMPVGNKILIEITKVEQTYEEPLIENP